MEKENGADKYAAQYFNFIQMAAHDLESPVRKLAFFTDRLLELQGPGENADIDRYGRRMRSCMAEIQSLIRGFVVLATLLPETMRCVCCDTGQLVKTLLLESADLINEKKSNITMGDMPVIEGDSKQLRLMFKELLDNSIRFSKPGIIIKINIGSEKLSPAEKQYLNLTGPGSYYKISIADNGIGVAAEDTTRIFNPLVRLQGKSEYPGNGLGLAIVKKVAENHQGMIYAEDNNGEGLKVVLLIPEKRN